MVTHAAASSSSGTLVPAAGADSAATGLVGTTPHQAPPPLPPPPLSPTSPPAPANSVVTGPGDPSPNMAALQLTGPAAVRQAFGSKAFVAWLRELSPDRLAEVTESIDSFAAAHSEWLRAHANHAKAGDVLPGSKKRSSLKANLIELWICVTCLGRLDQARTAVRNIKISCCLSASTRIADRQRRIACGYEVARP